MYRALRRRIHIGQDKFPRTEEITSLEDEEIPPNHSNSDTLLIEVESSSMMALRIRGQIALLPERQIEALL